MKKVLAGLLTVIISFLFVACGADTSDKQLPDTDTVADALVNGLQFGDEIEKTPNAETVLLKYGIDDGAVVSVSRYVGSGATADEVAVFECTDEGVNQVKKAIDDRIEYLTEGYSDYGPEEVPKIKDAAVVTCGNVVIFCISNDSSSVNDIIYNL